VVAIFFALIIYLVLNLKLIDIKMGSPSSENANSIYLITSFLCGFSERFAQDSSLKLPRARGSSNMVEDSGSIDPLAPVRIGYEARLAPPLTLLFARRYAT